MNMSPTLHSNIQSFKDQRDKTIVDTNPLEPFLRNTELVQMGAQLYYSWTEFKKDYLRVTKEDGQKEPPQLNPFLYEEPFGRHGIKFVPKGQYLSPYDGTIQSGPHLLGIAPSQQRILKHRERLHQGRLREMATMIAMGGQPIAAH